MTQIAASSTPTSITTRPNTRWLRSFARRSGERFGIEGLARMHDNPVGPHPRGSCQSTIPT